MRIRSKEDILRKVQSETKFSEDQIKLAIKYLWRGVRHYLTNPHEAPGNILLNKFISLYIDADYYVNHRFDRMTSVRYKEAILKLKELKDDGKKKKQARKQAKNG